jgi:polyisoprenoid-binding protein YceI
MTKIYILISFLLCGLFVSAQQKLTPVDASSQVHFTIKNFAINTNGKLSGLKGQIVFDRNKPANSSFDITADVASINTDNNKRDNHLRAEDFFDAARYPVIRITGKAINVAANSYLLKGNLTIKNITKAIEIPFTTTPQGKGLLFEGAFRINRLDYTVGKESATMADELTITLKVLAE